MNFLTCVHVLLATFFSSSISTDSLGLMMIKDLHSNEQISIIEISPYATVKELFLLIKTDLIKNHGYSLNCKFNFYHSDSLIINLHHFHGLDTTLDEIGITQFASSDGDLTAIKFIITRDFPIS